MSNVTCKTCRHSFRKLSDFPQWGMGHEYRCKKVWIEDHNEFDPVIGPTTVKGYYKRCNLVRLHEAKYNNDCGKEGLWWEPKSKKNFFLYLKRI